MLVSLDIVNMFPSIDNESGLQAVKNALEARVGQFLHTLCTTEALELSLKRIILFLIRNIFLRPMALHIAIEQFHKKALQYHPPATDWKRFRDDIFLVWPHSEEDLNLFFNCMNNIIRTKKIQFNMEVADALELLDLKLRFDKEYKRISVDLYANATNSFTYVLLSTCFPDNCI